MRIGIVGTGLIGASIGLGLRRAGWETLGWDPDSATLATAVARGAVDAVADRSALLTGCDVVVLAGPPGAVEAAVGEMETATLVVDVASVKAPILAASRLPRFVGTHPMAGREMPGPGAASATLFGGAAWVVVTEGVAPDDLETVRSIIATLGARTVEMSAEDHDVAVAVVSHLPQLLASTLMNEAADRTDAMDLVAGSFRDLTRVAASDPHMWVDVLDANREPILGVLEEFLVRLRGLADAVAAGDREVISDQLTRARSERHLLGPQTAAVRIAIADEPGQLARVGRAFEESGVDVRDLQLRHAPYGGGGVLTVSVRAGDEQVMRTALETAGLILAD